MQKNMTPGRRKGCPNYSPEFKQQLVAACQLNNTTSSIQFSLDAYGYGGNCYYRAGGGRPSHRLPQKKEPDQNHRVRQQAENLHYLRIYFVTARIRFVVVAKYHQE